MSNPRRRRDIFRTHAGLLLAGMALFGVVIASEGLLLPPALESAGRAVYRLAFWIIFPAIVPLRAWIRSNGHHWPTWGWAAACFATPHGYWLAWRALLAWRELRARLLAPAAKPAPPEAVARRAFIAKAGAGGLTTIVGATAGYGAILEPQFLKTRLYEVSIRGLPASLDGIRVVHVSDTHYGPFTALSFVREAIDRANALNADLIVLTGDYVHKTPNAIAPGIEILSGLRARLGVAAVLGNHDHWEGAGACREAFRAAGIPLLDNRRLYLGAAGLGEEPLEGESICVAGVGDLWEDEALLDQALKGAPEAMPRLLLSHNPDVAETMSNGSPRVDLMFSGHTHGGQVAFPLLGSPVVPSAYGQKYAGGLCQGPRCPVIVSRGVGMAMLPVRFRVPPEIGVATLRRAPG